LQVRNIDLNLVLISIASITAIVLIIITIVMRANLNKILNSKIEVSVNQNTQQLDNLSKWLIFIALAFVVLAVFGPFVLTNYLNPKFYKDKGVIGDTFGGLMSPFIAIAGICGTFLAFYMQFKANQIQLSLFNRSQENNRQLLKEQLFIKLMDNLNQRIVNYSILKDNVEIKNIDAIKKVLKDFKINLSKKCIILGKDLLIKSPENVDTVYFMDILEAKVTRSSYTIDNGVNYKKKIISLNETDRWSNIQGHFNMINNGEPFLKKLGVDYFYRVEFKKRKLLYQMSYDEIFLEYGGFLDGYFRSIEYLLDFINIEKENEFYRSYFLNNLSLFERILLFYYCTSSGANKQTKKLVHEFSLLNDLNCETSYLIDAPNEEVYNTELKNILLS
jgi:hypothetical protein